MIQLQARINDKELKILLIPKKDCFDVTVEGTDHLLDCKRVSDYCYSFILDHKSRLLHFEKQDKRIVVTIDHRKYELQLRDELEQLLDSMGVSQADDSLQNKITATIPGIIRKIEVNEGDEVTEGQGLLVLEAMKMENELKSPRAGTVKKIFVNEGQTIEKGLLLLELN